MAAVLISKGLEQAKIKIPHEDKKWKDSDNQIHVLTSKTHPHPHKCMCIKVLILVKIYIDSMKIFINNFN